MLSFHTQCGNYCWKLIPVAWQASWALQAGALRDPVQHGFPVHRRASRYFAKDTAEASADDFADLVRSKALEQHLADNRAEESSSGRKIRLLRLADYAAILACFAWHLA